MLLLSILASIFHIVVGKTGAFTLNVKKIGTLTSIMTWMSFLTEDLVNKTNPTELTDKQPAVYSGAAHSVSNQKSKLTKFRRPEIVVST